MSDPGTPFELGSDGPRLVVVGVDGSDVSFRAAAYAMGMARRHGSELIAVQVESEVPATAYLATAAPEFLPAIYASQEDIQQKLADQITADCRTWSVRCSLIHRHGDPADQLADVADRAHADMVVVGASTSIAHRLSGSLPRRLSRRRRWVLTIVP